ncbi:MAG: dephospho-CoA kinase [Alistipes senegalensis]|nr:dephospho-CoA kinase [Bacteroides cellulosilyticus]MCM1351762.1 dephospho-CoA kinase [Alistipes senegalensis]
MKVGVTGGIGSGKSTVCRLFAQRGIAVYDSDREAKRLMSESADLRIAVVRRFGADIYQEDVLDRARLAACVFSDAQALADLNALVHPAVMRDFAQWADAQPSPYVILESAILFEAGLQGYVDRTVAVLAPAELRIQRACRRDRCDEAHVRSRMAAQMSDDELCTRADFTMVNILESDLEPSVAQLDGLFRQQLAAEAAKCNSLK